jgi:hypothetical protein
MQNAYGQIQRNTELPKQDGAYLENMLKNLKAAVEGLVVNPDEPHGVNAQKPFFAIAGSELLEKKTTAPTVLRGFAAWDAQRNGVAVVAVGVFYDSAKSRDPKSLEERIVAHATELGADVVVLLPSAKDIRAMDPVQPLTMRYGAIAYAKTKTRLGLQWDQKMFLKGHYVLERVDPKATESARVLQIGDEILAIEDIPITDARIPLLGLRRAPGDLVKVTISRNGKREDVVTQAIAQ